METKRSLKVFILPVLIVGFILFLLFGNFFDSKESMKPNINLDDVALSSTKTLWQYQCVDTMKTSRDKARDWAKRSDLDSLIDKETSAIKDLGANCISLDTPYDAEFLPFLTKWVTSARSKGLLVAFRGNFSSWEGWFGYKKETSTSDFLAKTTSFIETNPNLFVDGDVFTAAPEAENGGPFNQVSPSEYASYKEFLIAENTISKAAFEKIGKKVTVNWLSMNGGFAKRLLDQSEVDSLGKIVSIDHYVKNTSDMGDYINYFATTFGVKLVIGEFGAPIPEINGKMTEDQQASFVDSLLNEMYKYKDAVIGVNYWDLYDGSTALYNPDYSPRKVVGVLKKYFKPTVITGKVKDAKGNVVVGAAVKTKDGNVSATTNENGIFELVLPANATEIELSATKTGFNSSNRDYKLKVGSSNSVNPLYLEEN